MTETESREIQKRGANARARGEGMFSNPYLGEPFLPKFSGDTIEAWQAKHDSWHLGWTVEDAMR